MTRPSTLDLFSDPPARPAAQRPLTISELNARAAKALDGELGAVTVVGEISGFVGHRSGHWYFTLKDAGAQVACACFKGSQRGVTFAPKDGASVVARGRVTVYAPRGSYQLVIDGLKLAGDGALQQRLELLKQKLAAEGLFAPERKRPLPRFPRRIGVLTSPDGAAVRDFLRVACERDPGIDVLVLPAKVQGQGSAEEVARMIALASTRAEELGLDVLVVTRGGGSIEDLWSFNEEAVVRALAACRIPTVSAIGHEVDSTLSDFVADVRAPTPTAAAQIVVPEMRAYALDLRRSVARLQRALHHTLERRRSRLARARATFRDPSRQLSTYRQRLDVQLTALEHAVRGDHAALAAQLGRLKLTLERNHPRYRLSEQRARVERGHHRLRHALHGATAQVRERLGRLASQLDALSPLAVLGRGYSVTLSSGRAVRRPSDAPPGTELDILLAEGRINATVIAKKKE